MRKQKADDQMRGSPTAEIFFDNVEIPDGGSTPYLGADDSKCIG